MWMEKLAESLPERLRGEVLAARDELREIRLRAGQTAALVLPAGLRRLPGPVSPEELKKTAAALMDYSMYAWEDELAQGYFTLEGGCRVGVCGRFAAREGRITQLTELQSLCLRIPREVKGGADELFARLIPNGRPASVLIVSRPGLGKTTCLRELARRFSASGWNVGLADERGELASLKRGVPLLDVGPNTDVIDLCPKHIALRYLVRSMAPDVVVTDEVGDLRDAGAILDARRCGVAVIASAHGAALTEAMRRPALRAMVGAFDLAALLEGRPGELREVRTAEELSWT